MLFPVPNSNPTEPHPALHSSPPLSAKSIRSEPTQPQTFKLSAQVGAGQISDHLTTQMTDAGYVQAAKLLWTPWRHRENSEGDVETLKNNDKKHILKKQNPKQGYPHSVKTAT